MEIENIAKNVMHILLRSNKISKLSVCFLPVLKHSLVGYKTKKKVIQKTLFMPYLLGLGHFKLL